MAKKYKYAIGIDPSGAFKEGSGTTGWCVIECKSGKIIEVGTIAAKDFKTYHDYWDAHINKIKHLVKRYGMKTCVSMEDYILYKDYAMSQVNSQMETVQLIGIIKHFCFMYAIDYYIRPAAAVKKRWSDDILVHNKVLVKLNKHYVLPSDPTRALCDHERDAIRHAIHFNTFENKEV